MRARKHKRLCQGKPPVVRHGHLLTLNTPQLPCWPEPERDYPAQLTNSTDITERRIIQDVSDLGNFVLATQAMQSLAR